MKKLLTGLFVLFFLLLTYQGSAQFTINNSFMTNDETGIVRGGGAKLTSGIEDPFNQGWLRLTSDTYDQSGYAYMNQSFSSTLGVLVEFDYCTWRSKTDSYNGADGITVFLFDAAVPIFKVGAFGGSLGYAPKSLENPPIDGLSGGYVGIGLDEYGNYSNPTEGRVGGIGFKPNSIGLRGPASSNYAYVTSTQLIGTSIQAGQYAVRPTSQQFYRRVQVEIKPSGGLYRIIVSLKTTEIGKFAKVFETTISTPPPANLKLGFAASTGTAINNHEIRNLRITTPANVSIQETVDKPTAVKGDKINYTLLLRNDSDDPAIGLPVTEELRDGNGNLIPLSTLSIDDIVFNDGGYAGNKVTTQPIKTNPFNAVVEMEAHSSSAFIISGTLKVLPPGGLITSNASIHPEAALPKVIQDIDLSNNNASVITVVSGGELTLNKTAVVGPYTKTGDVIRYNMVLKNTGSVTITNVAITDANADAGSVSPTLIPSLAVGVSTNIVATHTVTQADVEAGYVSNLAKADGKDPNNVNVHVESTDPTPIAGAPADPLCAACTVTPVVQSPAFTVTKIVTEKTYKGIGEVMHYTIIVKNTGNVTLNTVLVTDPLTVFSKSIPTLAPGASDTSKVTYTILLADLESGKVVNTVTLTGKTPGGQNVTPQTASATVTFATDGAKDVFIPNVITPNADGKNDQFRITRLSAYPNSELMIFNRWGNMVFRSTDYKNDWDGKGLNEGTYYYALLLNTPTGKIKYAGWVQLLR